MTVRKASATASMVFFNDAIVAWLLVISLERLYHSFAICCTIVTPSGLVNAFAQRLAARSISACAVSFCIIYSPITASPSLNALVDVLRCFFRMSTRSAIVVITATRRAPSEPRSLNTPSSAFILPRLFIASNISTMAFIVLPCSNQ